MSQAPPAWLEGARLAPSAHNTQPWRFRLGGGEILIRWDAARSLPAGDPTKRDLYLALGAAAESARLAAAATGVCLRFITRFNGGERTVGALEEVGESPDPGDRQLGQWLSVRQTARTPHLRRPIPSEVLTSLQNEAEAFGSRLHLVLEGPPVGRLAALAGLASAAQYADPAVHAELWRWLRLYPNDPAYRRDGLTAECLNLRGVGLTIARLAMPPPQMRWLVRLRVHRLLAVDTALLVRKSAALCLLTVPAATPIDLVRAGRLLLRLWLMATAAGMTTHPVSALLDCAATAGRTVSIFQADGETPAALFRLGATPPATRAPRLPTEELLELDDHPH